MAAVRAVGIMGVVAARAVDMELAMVVATEVETAEAKVAVAMVVG